MSGTMSRSKLLVAALTGAVLSAPGVFGQGRRGFLNVESPQVAPIAVARLAGHDYVLACNTPDSALEVYDTVGTKLVARVPVGQEPVSVTWSPGLGRAYVACMLGDSISVVRLERRRTGGLDARLERTAWVGDEPMMVAVHEPTASVLVTLNQQSAIGWRDARTLAPIVPGFSERIELVDSVVSPTAALKEPRRVVLAGTWLWVLGYRGGHSPFFHDMDLWGLDFAAGRLVRLGGLGTLKAGLAVAGNGELWVAGAEAQNHLRGQDALRNAKTGFVKSLLHRVRGLQAGSPKVDTRDLNADASGAPVPKARALAHPTDVLLLEEAGAVKKVFVAAFHSDRLGIVVPATDPAKWVVRTLDIPTAPNSVAKMAGPRAMALKRPAPGVPGDPGMRLYVLNRIDQSLAVVDPLAEKVVGVVRLANEPEPIHVRRGRRYLYSAKLSGHGFVACASCHVDGRTDGLAWDGSGPPSSKPKRIPADFVDGVTDARILTMTHWPVAKGRMLTQSLQGLLNREVEGAAEALVTNAPLHWRGDTDLRSFNGAFVSLMGMRNLAGPGQPPRGIPVEDMEEFVEFVHSISYPPNPEQPIDRIYSGLLGDPDRLDGSGALRGLKLFHTLRVAHRVTGKPDPALAGRSCVQCHFLPEGSNNKITRLGISTPQPIETAALRGLRQKEAVIEHDGHGVGRIAIGETGLEHTGSLVSINDFNSFVYGHQFPGAHRAELEDITQFVREFDTGVAPAVGLPWTVDARNSGDALTRLVVAFFEGQAARANVGVAVRGRLGGRTVGYWFDPTAGAYRAEPGPGLLSRAALLAAPGPGDVLVFECTPLGNERRLAAPDGRPVVRRGAAPSALELLPAPPDDAYARVPSFTRNWIPGPASDPTAFVWSGVYSGTARPVPEPRSLKSLRLLQYGLIQDGPGLGLDRLRHEAPRRLRVAGEDIRPGARLVVFVPDDPTTPPPYRKLDRTIPLVFPLYPTGRRVRGLAVWETAVELDPQGIYTLMLGGPKAPGVPQALAGALAEPPPKGTFQPGRWNRHWVWVVNEDGTAGTGGWQALRLQ